MVEPVRYVFERLRANYGGLDGVVLANVAVADRDGHLPFYYLAQPHEQEREKLPDWYDGIGSFSREAVLGHRHRIADIDARIVREDVECLSFKSLCERYGADRVDLLLVDTEGYDWEILAGIDFERRHPRLVIYEHFHLEAGVRAAARAHHERLGYETMEEGFDTFCLDARPDDSLTRVWRGLRPAVAGVYAEQEVAA
jgi:FkbM family methyltransferase